MKKLILVGVIAALLASTIVGIAYAGTGNGAPSGAHYNLNLIGMPKDKSADMTGSNGHVIFVDLTGKTRILLQEGPAGIFDFQVLDANGTDGTASFQLPNPDPDGDGITWYSVYARALGKPGGKGNITSGFIDPADGTQWLSVYSYLPVREKGKMTFENVSKELLYVYVDMDADGTVERYPLFDNALYQYFWDYDNQGLKLVQLRFYEVSTNVN
jgi:hypothetical protein